jgi:flagellar biosynthesis/type III secretory pathway chaperone
MDRETDVVNQLERLLGAERTAIIDLDAEKVEALALTKERLFGELKQLGVTELERARVRRIVDAARRNVLLLAHARELTRSAVQSITGDKRGVRVSVTG